MEHFKQIYGNKKVFLTGHTGFKGSWLLAILNMLGAEVKGYSLAPENEFDLYHLIDGDNLCTSVIGDLRDKEKLSAEIKQFQPDFIFHLAAQPLVRLSYEIPAATFEVNAMGTVNVLDAIRELEKPCSAVMITTDKVYHNEEWIYPYREVDRLGGYDPYSASKACAELIIDSYCKSFFNIADFDHHKKGIAAARAGNVIGGGDWSRDRLLPDICRALGNNQEIIIRNPTAIRPWQHVLEPLVGYLKLGAALYNEPLAFSQPFNFGPSADDVLSVEEMVQMGIKTWGGGTYTVPEVKVKLHEAKILKLDISKAIAELHWSPKMNAREAVKQTIAWYKVFFSDKERSGEYTKKQILDFMTP